MCRQCPTPGCLVLMIGTDPLCSKCWAKVPEKVRDAMAAAERRQARAQTIHAWQIGETEYQAAYEIALAFAQGTRAPLQNTQASAAAPAPIAG